MPNNHTEVFQIYLQPFQCSSFLKCVPQPKVKKKTKTSYFVGSTSFKVINVDTIKKHVSSTCNEQQ